MSGAVALALLLLTPLAAREPEVLRSQGGLPVHIAGQFQQPLAFEPAPGGFYVFDRRRHTVYIVDAARTTTRPLVTIGGEEGRILSPFAFDAAPDGSFAVADAPLRKPRVQIFNADGQRIAGFELEARTVPRVTIDSHVLNGVGALDYTGSTVLVSQPETGALITEYDLHGQPRRSIGRLRPTGQESDQDLHLALNSGFGRAAPDGGFAFVFQTGEPAIRRYDRSATLLYERHVQGRELDRLLAARPTVWPRRKVDDLRLPLVPPTVRAATLDPRGHLWISLAVPFLYEYDEDGDKLRAVELRAAGPMIASSLAFASPRRLLITPGLFEFDVGN
jgi:hypothetical protein